MLHHSYELNECKCGSDKKPDLDSDDMVPCWGVRCHDCNQFQHGENWTIVEAVNKWNEQNQGVLVDLTKLKEGDKVYYQPEHYKKDGRFENGMVKRIGNATSVFVVYNCGGEWSNFKDYTAASTNVSDLYLGWK